MALVERLDVARFLLGEMAVDLFFSVQSQRNLLYVLNVVLSPQVHRPIKWLPRNVRRVLVQFYFNEGIHIDVGVDWLLLFL